MITEREKCVMARDAYKVLKKTLDEQNWRYEEDKEKLVLTCWAKADVNGNDTDLVLWVGVIPDSMLVQVTSPVFLNTNEDMYGLVAVAISCLNYNLPVGDFDYDILTGSMLFRIANSYIDSPINTNLALDMIKTTIDCVSLNYGPLLKLARGNFDFERFITSMYFGQGVRTMDEAGNREKHTETVFQTLCEAVEHRGCSYRQSSDGHAVIFQMQGEYFPIDIAIRVDEELQQLRLLSKLPFAISEKKRTVEGPLATCIASHGLSNSNFDYEFFSGSIFYKVSESFLERDLSDGMVQYMIDLAFALVNEYSYKFYQLDQGKIGLLDLKQQ